MKTSSKTSSAHILLVGHVDHPEEIEQWLGRQIHCHQVDSLPGAIEHLRNFPVDLIVCDPAAVLNRDSGPNAQEASALLSMVDAAVCLTDPRGIATWSNQKFQQESSEVRERTAELCAETARQLQSQGAQSSIRTERRVRFRGPDDVHYEICTAGLLDLHGQVLQIAAVVQDLTLISRVQGKLEAIDQAGRELLSLDCQQFSRLDPQERLSFIEQKVLKHTRDLLHFDNFEIRILDRTTNRLDLVLANGVACDASGVEIYADAEGNGICGYVVTKGRSYLCPNVDQDLRYLPGVEGAKSSLTVPLVLRDRVIGVANFESTKLAAFNEDDRQFAEIFARYISLALHLLELLASERQTVTTRLAKNLLTEITTPLNDCLTDVETLVEDYIGHDDLRHRLRTISEHVQKIREGLQQVSNPKAGVIACRTNVPKSADPVLAGRKILLADDEEMIRETVRNVLGCYGCEVCAVSDGESAIEKLKTECFDLVLSDIKMPQRSGYEVFAAAKQANPNTPVILTTGFGYDPNHSIIRARREGLAAVLFKPFKVDQLLCEIRTALKSVPAS